MATLHERLIGDDDGEKIAIHAFIAALFEWQRGKLGGVDIAFMFELTTAQQNQALVLVGLLSAAPNKLEFMRVFKDWLYLGEDKRDSRYLDTTMLVDRLEEEVTDQGGTLP